jgi:hypothetical protein
MLLTGLGVALPVIEQVHDDYAAARADKENGRSDK